MKAAFASSVVALSQMALFAMPAAVQAEFQQSEPDPRQEARERVLSALTQAAKAKPKPTSTVAPSIAQLLEKSRELDAVGEAEHIGITDYRIPFADAEIDTLREGLLVGSLKDLLDDRCAIATRVEVIQWIYAPLTDGEWYSESFSFEDCCYAMDLRAEEMQELLRFVLRRDPAYALALSPTVLRAYARDLAVKEAQLSITL